MVGRGLTEHFMQVRKSSFCLKSESSLLRHAVEGKDSNHHGCLLLSEQANTVEGGPVQE